jgi:hypothetical protein
MIYSDHAKWVQLEPWEIEALIQWHSAAETRKANSRFYDMAQAHKDKAAELREILASPTCGRPAS